MLMCLTAWTINTSQELVYQSSSHHYNVEATTRQFITALSPKHNKPAVFLLKTFPSSTLTHPVSQCPQNWQRTLIKSPESPGDIEATPRASEPFQTGRGLVLPVCLSFSCSASRHMAADVLMTSWGGVMELREGWVSPQGHAHFLGSTGHQGPASDVTEPRSSHTLVSLSLSFSLSFSLLSLSLSLFLDTSSD